MSNYLDGSSFHNRRVYTQFEGREGWFCSIPGKQPVFMNRDETEWPHSQHAHDLPSPPLPHPPPTPIQRPQSHCIFSQIDADSLDLLFQSPIKTPQPQTPPPPPTPRECLFSKAALDSLVQSVDESIVLDRDVSELLKMYADDLVNELVTETARAVRIRDGKNVTVADVNFALRYRSKGGVGADKSA